MTPYSRITGTGSYLPPRRVSNVDLASELAVRGIETSQTTSSIDAQRAVSIFLDDLPLTTFAVVTPDGRVRAAWRGSGTLRVELGAVAVDVPVAADWAPRCEARDGRAAPGAAPPHLVVEPVGEGQFDVQCANLPPATFRLLVASPQPLPDSPVGVDTLGMTTVPIPGDAPTATLRLAHATAPGRPLFVRVVALAPNAVDVVAASNTVVLTPP